MLIGYARVSTVDQDTALQLDALSSAGVHRIFEEMGGGVGPRPQLQHTLGFVTRGDTLVIWKLDRMARSLFDLRSITKALKDTGVTIRSITGPIDISSPIREFTLQVLGALAQLERSIILQRTAAGLEAALARGVKFGRDRVLSPELEHELAESYIPRVVTIKDLARRFGVSESVVKRAIYRVYKPEHSSLG